MSEWAKRVRVEKATYGQRGRSEFVLTGQFESRDEYEAARLYLENLVNVGIKADMLDALREELATRDQELAVAQGELHFARLALANLEKEVEPLRLVADAAQKLSVLLGSGAGYNR